MADSHAAAPHLMVITTNYLETTGGVEGHLQALLPLVRERGYVVSIAYLGSNNRVYRDDNGIQVISLKRQFDFRAIMAVPSPRTWNRFAKDVQEHRFGAPVTHIATHTRFFPMSWLAVRLGKKLNIPVLHTEHGGGFVSTSSALVEAAAKATDYTLGRSVLRGATKVLAVSEESCDFVEKLSGIPATVFNNGVDLERWLSPPSASAERALVYAGRVVQEKGWRTFLKAAAAARRNGWAGAVHLLGDGVELDAARSFARELGLGDAHIPGRVGPEDVRAAMQGNVYVNPSVASEGFQLTLVEALATGASVVSNDVGGAREIAKVPGAQVWVVPKGDEEALIDAVGQALAAKPSSVAADDLKRWDWGVVADTYVEHLNQLTR